MEDIFVLNGDQRAILETVARFVEGEVKPRAAALDANPHPEKSLIMYYETRSDRPRRRVRRWNEINIRYICAVNTEVQTPDCSAGGSFRLSRPD